MKLSVPQVKVVRKLFDQVINKDDRGKLAFADGTKIQKPCFIDKLMKRDFVQVSECGNIYSLTEKGRSELSAA